MDIRTMAFRAGGAELVKKIDFAQTIEEKALIGITELMKAWQEDAEGDDEKLHLITLALCQALSRAYAAYSVEAFNTRMKDSAITERSQVVTVAVQSINANLNRAWETYDARCVKDAVAEAVAKIGPLPKAETKSETEE